MKILNLSVFLTTQQMTNLNMETNNQWNSWENITLILLASLRMVTRLFQTKLKRKPSNELGGMQI